MEPEMAFRLTAPAIEPREPRIGDPKRIFERVYRELRPRAAMPSMEVRFCAFANPNSYIRLKDAAIQARLSDLLESAPEEVLEALARILLSKLYRCPAPADAANRYRRHLARKDVRARIAQIRQSRGRKELAPPTGHAYDLNEIFETLNARYFHGLMSRPALGWSVRASRQTLGHYDSSHHAIVLSRILDSPSVPRLAVEFVLYHEMLHIRFPVEHRAGRRRIHTPEFKAEERRFEGYAEARAALRLL